MTTKVCTVWVTDCITLNRTLDVLGDESAGSLAWNPSCALFGSQTVWFLREVSLGTQTVHYLGHRLLGHSHTVGYAEIIGR